jgi:hypothetical protein
VILDGVLQDFLRNGVTSIRDLGAGYPWTVELRHSADEGWRAGPRIFAAGPMLTAPGGHPAGTLLVGNTPAISAGTRQIATPEEGRAAVRELAGGGVDVIKAVLGSGGRRSRPRRIATLDAKTLAAIVGEAHSVRLPVTVHWRNVDELPTIIASGPTQIEHAGYSSIPQSMMGDIARAGIVVDPTLAVFSSVASPEEFAHGLSTTFAVFTRLESQSLPGPTRRSAICVSARVSIASSNCSLMRDCHRWRRSWQPRAGPLDC